MYDKSQNLKTLEFFTIFFKSFQSRFYIVKGYIIYLNYKILFIHNFHFSSISFQIKLQKIKKLENKKLINR